MLICNASSHTCTFVIYLQALTCSYLQIKRWWCARGLFSIRVEKNKGAVEGNTWEERNKLQAAEREGREKTLELGSNFHYLQKNKTWTRFNLKVFIGVQNPPSTSAWSFLFPLSCCEREKLWTKNLQKSKDADPLPGFGPQPCSTFWFTGCWIH